MIHINLKNYNKMNLPITKYSLGIGESRSKGTFIDFANLIIASFDNLESIS